MMPAGTAPRARALWGRTPQGWPVLYPVAHTKAILLGQACRVLKGSCLEGWDTLLTLEFPLFSVPPAYNGRESGSQGLFTVSCEVLAHRFSL